MQATLLFIDSSKLAHECSGAPHLLRLSAPPRSNKQANQISLAGEGLCAVAAARQAGPAHAERIRGTAAVALRARAGGRVGARPQNLNCLAASMIDLQLICM